MTKGASGPSQLDAEQYRHILASSKYKLEGKHLREQIALLGRKLASEIVDPSSLEALVACRLIPLDKCPGVRPIGVGEVLRRLIGKTIGWALKEDIQFAAGPLQAATGLQGGAEAAIHAMKNIFESQDTEAVILVDADNAFNKLNRQVALHNIQHICPPFATILTNTYRQPSRLFVAGGKEMLSCEGSTQGDNLAGTFYFTHLEQFHSRIRSGNRLLTLNKCGKLMMPQAREASETSSNGGISSLERAETRLSCQRIKVMVNSQRSHEETTS